MTSIELENMVAEQNNREALLTRFAKQLLGIQTLPELIEHREEWVYEIEGRNATAPFNEYCRIVLITSHLKPLNEPDVLFLHLDSQDVKDDGLGMNFVMKDDGLDMSRLQVDGRWIDDDKEIAKLGPKVLRKVKQICDLTNIAYKACQNG